MPVRDNVIVYNDYGKAFKLSVTDTIISFDVFKGSWAGKTGEWIWYVNHEQKGSESSSYFVLLKEMKDVEKEALVSDEIANKQRRIDYEKSSVEKTKLMIEIISIALAVLVGVILSARLFSRAVTGYTNRCPRCYSWNARILIDHEVLDVFTYKYDVIERTHHRGVFGGTVYTDNLVTKTGGSVTYHEKFRCKKCDHEWERTKST